MNQKTRSTSSEDTRKATGVRNDTTEDALPPCRRMRTLLVDDSDFGMKTLVRILADHSAVSVVGTAVDGYQAIRQVILLKPDLVIMDYYMPHLNGIEATVCIKQFANPPSIIIVSSNDASGFAELLRDSGADGVVDKAGDLRAQLERELCLVSQKWSGATLIDGSSANAPKPSELPRNEGKCSKIDNPDKRQRSLSNTCSVCSQPFTASDSLVFENEHRVRHLTCPMPDTSSKASFPCAVNQTNEVTRLDDPVGVQHRISTPEAPSP